jgi:hypothetical protein
MAKTLITNHLNCLICKMCNINWSNKLAINKEISESNNIH